MRTRDAGAGAMQWKADFFMVRRRACAVSNHPSRRGPLPSLRRQRTLACVAAPQGEVFLLELIPPCARPRVYPPRGGLPRGGFFVYVTPHRYLIRSYLPCRPAGSFSALSSFSCFSLLPPTTGWSRSVNA